MGDIGGRSTIPASAEEIVRSAVKRLQSADRNATGFILPGDPKAVILDRARSIGADLIVTGSHGVSAVARFLLGNVAAAVLRYAPCSVEVVRARAETEGLGSMRVLLATDGSEYSFRAAHSLAGRPWPAGAEVRVLSAVELILPTTRVFLEPPFVDSQFIETARVEAMQRAQDAITQSRQILSLTGLDVSESISVLLEAPKTIILDEAAHWGADLIVLGSHGRHGVDRFLLGSVSEAVAMHAACSVEVVRKSL
jgi:nucleotide-binding universal stress UspA family protein